ncbi:hypothetical protein [Kordiimonas sp. SCSIO 12610]|uniref:hypothetical protein n=1 Tax=Kordiimonas sp. SCSIO 12610 TaxID=2829597 RepID=UPI0021091476|nr:hypothetical protein [Kordiimonas sp. SCSIO 12610]UTW56689.1 hypothetical protein KFF44_07315 [Kordiimonas sp. SCSIO 12610]
MTERVQIFHHMGSKRETFIYKNEDGSLTLRTENEGVRVLRDGVNPRECEVTLDTLRERFKGSSLLSKIEEAVMAAD